MFFVASKRMACHDALEKVQRKKANAWESGHLERDIMLE